MNALTSDQLFRLPMFDLASPPWGLPDRPEAIRLDSDEGLFPPSGLIEEEMSKAARRELSDDLRCWVEQYALVGNRNEFLWKWCCRGVELTTLPCVKPAVREELCDTKVLGVMLDVLLDDVADQKKDVEFLEHLIGLLCDQPAKGMLSLSAKQRGYAELTAKVWAEIQSRIRRYPCFDKYAELLRFDYLQLFNAMRYSDLVNRDPALLCVAEHDLYLPHNMHMMASATIDLMNSPDFDRRELGLLREAVWHAQCMGRIGNLVTTWQRELREGDYTSGVFALAVRRGDVTVSDLLEGDQRKTEDAIIRGRPEAHFLRRWRRHRRRLAAMRPRISSVDLELLMAGLDRLICLHLGSRGYK